MLNKLAKIANKLDEKGLYKQADTLDSIIKQAGFDEKYDGRYIREHYPLEIKSEEHIDDAIIKWCKKLLENPREWGADEWVYWGLRDMIEAENPLKRVKLLMTAYKDLISTDAMIKIVRRYAEILNKLNEEE